MKNEQEIRNATIEEIATVLDGFSAHMGTGNALEDILAGKLVAVISARIAMNIRLMKTPITDMELAIEEVRHAN